MENVMGLIENRSAQFMLLAGFIIAIGLVITTVMLNNVIFQSNMAGEAGAEPYKYDMANLMQVTKDEMRLAYRNAIALGGNDTRKRSNFTNQTRNFSALLPRIFATHAEGVNVSLNISNWNSSLYANFTDNGIAGGAGNWTVMESVKNSTITVNITAISSSPFNINITNATKTWQINFTSPGNRTITNANITANITSAYTISFVNGSYATGNYSITGNTTYGRNFTRARDYILNATVTLSTSRVRLNVTIPVSVPW